MIIEACVDSLPTAVAAEQCGAHRLEVCANLDADGMTPSHGLVSMVLERVAIPVFAMVRPNEGPFTYTADEVELMRREVKHFRWLGAHGIVTGALTSEGQVDSLAMTILMDAAKDIPVTFHRAFDEVDDPFAAIEELKALGVARILTAGQHVTAWKGRKVLKELRQAAGDGITIVAGGGIRGGHVARLVAATGVEEIHLRATGPNRLRRVLAAIERP
ncbi:MAG: copper homeostasis protein CutC [Gemmatimonadales bacterium]|nr:copper homeostasis protein CutC [Gemmatimonadales bacterium]